VPKPQAPVLSSRALNRASLARQLLLQRADLGPLDAIGRLFAIQAQYPKAPSTGLWSRLRDLKRDDLARLVDERRVVRATFLRGTLHLLSARDYLDLRASLQTGLTQGLAVLGKRAEGLDAARLIASAQAFFEQRGAAEFEDLREVFAATDPDGDIRAMAYLVRLHLPLVQAPDDGPFRFAAGGRFTLARSFLNEAPAADLRPDVLVRRYLAAYGPASIADAQVWLGLKALKPTFEALRPELVTFRDERGRELFDLADAPRPPDETPAPVRFLPDFDGLLLGWDDRSRVVSDEHRKRLVTKNLLVLATFLVDGRAAGLWKAELKRGAARLLLEPFERLTKKVRTELEAEGQRLLTFLEPEAKSHDVVLAEA
jgi:winged helix DNA-binding protein